MSALRRILRQTGESLQGVDAAALRQARNRAENCRIKPRGFCRRLAQIVQADGNAIIAEFKPRSPSAGTLRQRPDPADFAALYESGGAACMSVLTERHNFAGDPAYLGRARAACGLPLLRKDFLVHPWQVCESRTLGADAVLLIAAAMDAQQMGELAQLALSLGLDLLLEAHNSAQLEAILALPGLPPQRAAIGINSRDLHSLDIDKDAPARLVAQYRGELEGRLVVAESGIEGRADIARLRDCGVRCFLVGGALMRSGDPAAALAQMRATV